ncbi:hypothetical protein QBC47DRAFT_439153 [Echria macrotheca]|uniref:WD-like domain-containing protein n=1 Tax=Echria macrotheca TaxID=438768 RepID=A0AAJ0F6C5_9PEZI|nr:hypothetical protein QBC47DRAFT_439153 [Echria macrotheca]
MLASMRLVTLLAVALGTTAQAASVSVRQDTAVDVPMATNLGEVENGFLVINKEDTEHGTLVWYAHAATPEPEPESDGKLNKRCGSNKVECDNSHVPRAELCAILLNDLEEAYFDLRTNPRSLCLSQGADRCCVSWSKTVNGLNGAHLHTAASQVFSTCVWYRAKSGLTRDTNLNGVCVTQCLSNRPDGCT